jgi:hypothetical protein
LLFVKTIDFNKTDPLNSLLFFNDSSFKKEAQLTVFHHGVTFQEQIKKNLSNLAKYITEVR